MKKIEVIFMFNLNSVLIKKTGDSTTPQTNPFGVTREGGDLSSVHIYSSIGSQTPMSVKKQDTDLWTGLIGGLFR
jgi:hypothetical protein